MAHADLLCTFYGDDLTGSTDAMEALTLNGVPAALFLSPPTPGQLARDFPDLRAVGVAGTSRAMSPAAMDAALTPAFQALAALNAPLCHYKVCSTFDSSPGVGSIGRATEIGQSVFGSGMTPMLVAAPSLRRYMAFGNLFATVGETTHRLDRHPTMSRHPITPMNEADLRLHLAAQTSKRIGLIDVLQLDGPDAELDARLSALRASGVEIVLLDTMTDDHLCAVGRLMDALTEEGPLFVVGSSGVEYALTAWWQRTGVIAPPAPLPWPGEAEQIIVMSGSASPVTAGQIDWALEQGYAGLRLPTESLLDSATREAARREVLAAALDALASGCNLVLYATRGPDDPAIAATRAVARAAGLDPAATGRILARLQGEILRVLIQETGLTRICVTGGDSSGQVAHALGIIALEVLAPIAPGAPLCRATIETPELDGLQIALKGGQCGDATYFDRIRLGRNS